MYPSLSCFYAGTLMMSVIQVTLCCVLCLPFFDSLSFIHSDFGMDVSGSSHALVVAAPAAQASSASRRTTHPSTTARRRAQIGRASCRERVLRLV